MLAHELDRAGPADSHNPAQRPARRRGNREDDRMRKHRSTNTYKGQPGKRVPRLGPIGQAVQRTCAPWGTVAVLLDTAWPIRTSSGILYSDTCPYNQVVQM